MSLKNDSHKNGTNARNTKNNTNHASKGSSTSKGGKSNHKGTQATRSNTPALQASDIRNLVQNHGRTQIGGHELALQTPSWNDSSLQAIINDPKFTAHAKGQSTADGKLTYELHGHGKTVNVIIGGNH